MKVPVFNSTHRKFTRRDSLGLQSLSSSLQAEICPVINVVTPHPFYWAFLTWNYCHYYSIPSNKNKSDSEFNVDFVKRNDFFFVLSNHIGNNDTDGIVGRENISSRFPDKNVAGPFKYDVEYYKSHFGGMQYYNNGCEVMGFVKRISSNQVLLKPLGIQLTEAFDEVIKNTEIYKKYISQDIRIDDVSRDDLLELSKCLPLKPNMNKVNNIIYNALFTRPSEQEPEPRLASVEKYINLLIDSSLIKKDEYVGSSTFRKLLYGDNHPAIFDKVKVTSEQKIIITRWELIIANQFFVASIEMLWKYMISILTTPLSKEKWIEKALDSSDDINLEAPLTSINNTLDYDGLEGKISNSMGSNTISSALAILMSVHNRFKTRTNEFCILKNLEQSEYRVFNLILKINNNEFKTVKELLVYLLEHHIIDRHETVAKEKRYQGRDGFLYEKADNLYVGRGETIDISLPSLRITNAFSVLKDLGKL